MSYLYAKPSLMFKGITLITGVIIVLSAGCGQQTGKPEEVRSQTPAQPENKDTCSYHHDTTLYARFIPDPTTSDFDQLIVFIKNKSGLTYKKVEKSDPGYGIVLKKMLCDDDYINPSMEIYKLDSLFFLRAYFQSNPKKKGDIGHRFSITQLNFANQEETDKAWDLVTKRSMGDPQKKWDEFQLVKGHRRIYELRGFFAATTYDVIPKLTSLVEKQWRPK
jgi:hypothetical protein